MAHRVSDRTTLVGMTHDISSIDIPHEYVICLDHVGIAVPDLDADGMVQLLAPLNEDSTIAKFIDKKGPGLQQMCVRTNNIDALSEHLRAQGTRLLYPEPKVGTGGARINFVHPKDANGVLLEITEPAS